MKPWTDHVLFQKKLAKPKPLFCHFFFTIKAKHCCTTSEEELHKNQSI